MPNRTLIIAEAGVNHNGDLTLAKRLIDVAVSAGADIVKFQSFSTDRLVTRNATKATYQVASTSADESMYEMLHKLELSEAMHDELITYCATSAISFMSSAFDERSVEMLASKGVSCFKIPSGEITNLPYLRRTAALAKEVIISTGMATMHEVQDAIAVFQTAGMPRDSISILHCTTEYPAPMKEVNLRAMLTMKDVFGLRVGYSDHTEGTEVSVAAVALGARIIEKHFTLDRNMPGPDHKASLEPDALSSMVAAIRNIELALGDGVKAPTASEQKNRLNVRKSLVAIRPIRFGEAYSTQNIGAKRPGTGISPMRLNEVLGMRARRDFAIDELIEL
jgi:N,N'-diacetyllegionaminate synthase